MKCLEHYHRLVRNVPWQICDKVPCNHGRTLPVYGHETFFLRVGENGQKWKQVNRDPKVYLIMVYRPRFHEWNACWFGIWMTAMKMYRFISVSNFL